MSDIDIVNRALNSLGNLPATGMADTAKNPLRAITAYPKVRDEILRKFPWPSCTTRALMENMNDQATPWQASHSYLLGERATNDTAKTYRVTRAGVSNSSGGPTGTGAGIVDGDADDGVIWAYVEASTALNNWAHIVLTAYVVGDFVIWGDDLVYECIIAGTTAAAAPPTGVDITDGTVHWRYYGTPPYNRSIYGYQYIIPADCLRIQKVPNLAATSEKQQGVQYSREGNWLYTDQDNSFLKYTRREEDVSRWDSLLQQTVASALASDIAYDVTSQTGLAVLAFNKATEAESQAREQAAGEGSESEPERKLWVDV